MDTISDTLRQAMIDSGVSCWRIARDTGLAISSLRRFVLKQNSLRLDLAGKLAGYLGYELRAKVKAHHGKTTRAR